MDKKTENVAKSRKKPSFVREYRASIILNLIFLIVSCIWSFVSVFALGSANKGSLMRSSSASSLDQIASDYDVPGLSSTQIEEIKGREDVVGVLPYFSFSGNAKDESGIDHPIKINFLDNASEMDLTPYFPSRLYEDSGTFDSESILVDYSFINGTSLGIGSKLTIEIGEDSIDLSISGISDVNYVDGESTCAAILTEEAKQYLLSAFFDEGKPFTYTSTYIACSDTQSFYDYIKDYLPEAERKTLEDFDGDQFDYAIWTEEFESQDYSGNIVSIKDVISQHQGSIAKLESSRSSALTGSLVMTLVGLLLVSFIKLIVEAKVVKHVDNGTKNAKPYFKLDASFGVATAIISGVLGCVAGLICLPSSFLSIFVPAIAASVIIPLTQMLVSFGVVKAILKRK